MKKLIVALLAALALTFGGISGEAIAAPSTPTVAAQAQQVQVFEIPDPQGLALTNQWAKFPSGEFGNVTILQYGLGDGSFGTHIVFQGTIYTLHRAAEGRTYLILTRQ